MTVFRQSRKNAEDSTSLFHLGQPPQISASAHKLYFLIQTYSWDPQLHKEFRWEQNIFKTLHQQPHIPGLMLILALSAHPLLLPLLQNIFPEIL